MRLSAFIPEWQIGSRDIAVPVVGEPFHRVLVFSSDDGNPAMHYGSFGQEVAVAATATPLTEHPGGVRGAFPTELRCAGFSLYWDAPHRVSGKGRFTGIVSTSGDGAAPTSFPQVRGSVDSLAIVSLAFCECVSREAGVGSSPGKPATIPPRGQLSPVAADRGFAGVTAAEGDRCPGHRGHRRQTRCEPVVRQQIPGRLTRVLFCATLATSVAQNSVMRRAGHERGA
ncbi:hypothetical protein [Arthrobacter alpinus]|nr:hypothetical protein [Arthrobacter alpinus]